MSLAAHKKSQQSIDNNIYNGNGNNIFNNETTNNNEFNNIGQAYMENDDNNNYNENMSLSIQDVNALLNKKTNEQINIKNKNMNQENDRNNRIKNKNNYGSRLSDDLFDEGTLKKTDELINIYCN